MRGLRNALRFYSCEIRELFWEIDTPSIFPSPNGSFTAAMPIKNCLSAEYTALRPLKSDVNTPIAASPTPFSEIH